MEKIRILIAREYAPPTGYDYEYLKEKLTVRFEDQPEKPATLLKMRGAYGLVEYFSCGDISAIVGRSGQGKSNLLSLVISEMINNENKEYFESQLNEKPIVWVDTEMSPYDVWRQLNKIKTLAGLTEEEISKRIILVQTMLLAPEDRKKFVFDLIKEYEPQLVIIDGIADLVPSINEEAIANEVVSEIRGFAMEHKAHIVGVIHSSDKNTQSKSPMGWVGTKFQHKAEGIMNVSYSKIKGRHEVEFSKGRHGIPNDWCFVWDDEIKGPKFVSPEESGGKTDKQIKIEAQELILDDVQEQYKLFKGAFEVLRKSNSLTTKGNVETAVINFSKDAYGAKLSTRQVKEIIKTAITISRVLKEESTSGKKILTLSSKREFLPSNLPDSMYLDEPTEPDVFDPIVTKDQYDVPWQVQFPELEEKDQVPF